MPLRTPKLTAYCDEPSWVIEPCDPWRPWFKEIGDAWKSCLPLHIASQMGWVIRCPFAFEACWMGRNEKEDLTVKFTDNDGSAFVMSHFGSGVLTFILPFRFTTTAPYGLIATGPFNAIKPGIHPLTGYVETQWSPYPFTMNWKISTVGQWIKFDKGDAVCMVMPYDATLLNQTRVFRKPSAKAPVKLTEQFRKWLGIREHHTGTTRDRLYLQGKCPITRLRMTKDHLLKLNLKKFTN